MRSSQHGPYVQGYTRATMAPTKGSKTARSSKSQKRCLNSDCSLQLDCMKLESLVTADEVCCGEYVLGPCTHRPSHHPSWFFLMLVTLTVRGRLIKEELVRGVKS